MAVFTAAQCKHPKRVSRSFAYKAAGRLFLSGSFRCMLHCWRSIAASTPVSERPPPCGCRFA
eukprot:2284265-Pleurochrysis_carterae.AAC.1